MEQRFELAPTTQSRARRWIFYARWMRFFFTEKRSPGVLSIIDLQRRAVWIGLALLCQSLIIIVPEFTIDQGNENTWYVPLFELLGALLPCGLTLGSFSALWMALKPADVQQQLEFARQHGARWQISSLLRTLGLLLIGCVLLVMAIIQWFLPPAYSNDGASLDANAAQLLLDGKNPYTTSSILTVAHRFHIQPNWTTPLRRGQLAGSLDYPSSIDMRSAFDTALKTNQAPEFESRVSYPALAFLTLLPFAWLKIANVLPFYLLSYLVLAWIAWKVTRDELKPWVLLLALANIPMIISAMTGSLDIFTIVLIVLAWLWREKRWHSALMLGLALASKQLAWFFVPFYLVLIWRQHSLREASWRLVVAGSLALAINLPFILWNPAAWLAGVLAPMADPMFPQGVGLINLSNHHLLPYFPSWCYLVLEVGAMGGALAYYWRLCRACPEAALLLAVLPLFLAWRSLPSYFSNTAFPIFLLLVARSRCASASTRHLQFASD